MIVQYRVVDKETGEVLKTGICPEEMVPLQVDDADTQRAEVVPNSD